MDAKRATKPISKELLDLMDSRGWRPLDIYAHGGPSPDATSRYINRKRALVANARIIPTLRKFERAFGLPQGYFLEEQLLEAIRELHTLAREGYIRLSDLTALIEAGRVEKANALAAPLSKD